jgi:hypothetical protein
MIPSKIKIFMWLLTNDAVLTKDNLVKRKWQGDTKCMFCEVDESIDHLFFQCPIARVVWSIVEKCFGATNIPNNLQQSWKWCETWIPYGQKYHPWGIAAICWAIWKNRNKACFENKIIQNPLEVICHACALMNFWTGLFTNIDKEQLEEGVATMLRVAKQLLSVQQKEQPGRPDADG